MAISVDIQALRQQCRVDYEDDDAVLLGCGDAAEAEVIRMTGRTVDELLEMGEGKFPAPLRMAVLIRAAQFYAQPEGGDKPNAVFESLIRPYQKI